VIGPERCSEDRAMCPPDDSAPPGDETSFTRLLERHRPALVRYLGRKASGLLKYENAEDLAQGVHLQALENRDRFAYQGEEKFMAWLFRLAVQHVADRHAYWHALKRNACSVLRVAGGDSVTGSFASAIDPPASITGPFTFAQRREMVGTAMKAVASLPPRDRDLVTWMSEGLSIQEMAGRLAITYAAAERARLRALERFRKAFELLVNIGE